MNNENTENQLLVLKKRLSTFKSGKSGQLRQIADEVLVDVLRAYERWPGSAAEFYRGLGLSVKQFTVLMGKAKKVYRDKGYVDQQEFQEIALSAIPQVSRAPCSAIELVDQGKVIRFPVVDQLLEFLKKAA